MTAAPVLFVQQHHRLAGVQASEQGDQTIARLHPALDLLDDFGAASLGERSPLVV